MKGTDDDSRIGEAGEDTWRLTGLMRFNWDEGRLEHRYLLPTYRS